jgi:hypothetical protein
VGKDILVCVHIRNILRARGCYRHVRVPSSPYKRGRKGTCKRIQTFLGLVLLAESFTVSLRPNLVPERVENSIRVWAVIRIFRVSPNIEPLPLPKGSETCLLQVILLFAFVWILIACWSFFLFVSFPFLFSRVTICGCCQCTHQGGD